jgi:RNA polymerase sigma factor (sigma-70 family)
MLLRKGRAAREVSIDETCSEEGASRDLEIPDSCPDPEANYLRREAVGILSAAMAQLRPGMRAAIELRELGELSSPETARHMGVSVSTIKTRVVHGRRKLREILRRSMRSRRMSRSTILAVAGNVNRISHNRLTCNA